MPVREFAYTHMVEKDEDEAVGAGNHSVFQLNYHPHNLLQHIRNNGSRISLEKPVLLSQSL